MIESMVAEPQSLRWHEECDSFADLVAPAATRTGYLSRLVEKDYFCSVVLQYLDAACPSLVFKGGTCLAKVHSEFHRLSEDLDFSIPVVVGASRSTRRELVREPKLAITQIEPVGRYAVRLVFDDGHNTGLFTWAVLYELCAEHDRKWARYLERLAQAGRTRNEPLRS